MPRERFNPIYPVGDPQIAIDAVFDDFIRKVEPLTDALKVEKSAEVISVLCQAESGSFRYALVRYRALPWDTLTAKETKVMRCVVDGLSNDEIAARQGNSPKTITTIVGRIFGKFHIHSRVILSLFALFDRIRNRTRHDPKNKRETGSHKIIT